MTDSLRIAHDAGLTYGVVVGTALGLFVGAMLGLFIAALISAAKDPPPPVQTSAASKPKILPFPSATPRLPS